MTAQEITKRVDEWVAKHYPPTMYEAHEIAIAKHACQAGLMMEE